VVVRFRAIGNAPIMRQNLFRISASHRFQAVILFLRRELHLKPHESLFLYVNSAFAPAPDEVVAGLHRCFSVDGQLIINYCTTPAWG
ncbi:ubiquitin-like protein Atg12, partial [Thamnocephalis sphaerospora]